MKSKHSNCNPEIPNCEIRINDKISLKYPKLLESQLYFH